MCNHGQATYVFLHFWLLHFQLWHFPLVLTCRKQVSKQRPVVGHFWLFSQNIQTNLDWKYRSGKTKRLQNVDKKIIYLPWLKENSVEKNDQKFSNQSGDVLQTSIHFTNYRSCCSQARSSRSESFEKFLATHPWWSTIQLKLLSRLLYRASLIESTTTCIMWALFKRTLGLVLNSTWNMYKLTDEVLQQVSEYFFFCQSTPAMQLFPSSLRSLIGHSFVTITNRAWFRAYFPRPVQPCKLFRFTTLQAFIPRFY